MRICSMVALAAVTASIMSMALATPVPTLGPRSNEFPDVIVSSVGSRNGNGIDIYGTYNDGSGAISAYAIASDSCNIGTAPAIWYDETSSGFGNQHPVIGGAVYRLFNGRFEQIGISWLKHGFCAADSCGSNGCTGTPGVTLAQGTTGCVTDLGDSSGDCNWLGYGRATDTYSAFLNGQQTNLGPRSEVNPWTGVYPYPYLKSGSNIGCLNKRLLVRKSDLNSTATGGYPGAQYFAEIVYIMTDEWPGQRYNNYSYRKLTVGGLGGTTGTGSCSGANTETTYALSFASAEPTIAMKPALEAWKTADPTVKLASGDVPNDGRFYVASKATNRGDGTWNYEYAVFNMNSDRGAASFMLPKSPAGAVQVTLPSNHFKGVQYHSGEGYALTPWTGTVAGSTVSWSTEPYALNQNANALRWSTMYNFRIIANRPPATGTVQLGLYKLAVQPSDPSVISIAGIDVPSIPACLADFDGIGGVTIDDIFMYLNAWLAQDPRADFDGIGGVAIDDIFEYLNAWFTGCP